MISGFSLYIVGIGFGVKFENLIRKQISDESVDDKQTSVHRKTEKQKNRDQFSWDSHNAR